MRRGAKHRGPVLRVGQCWFLTRARRYVYIMGFTLYSVRVASFEQKRSRYIDINDFLDRARSGAYRQVRR